jgi:hypothetical protein
MEAAGPGRERMETRFGPLGAGAREIEVAGHRYRLGELLARLDLAAEGCRGIDGFRFGPADFAVRYYDADEQRVVVVEFDADFRYRAETRVHVAEWVGEEGLALGGLP